MATMKQTMGALTNFSGATNLNSLPHNHAKMFNVVDFTANDQPNAKVYLKINLRSIGASGTSPQQSGLIDVYFIGSLEGTNWTDNLVPFSTVNKASRVMNAELVKSLNANSQMAGSTIVWICNDLAKAVGDLPNYWTLVVYNRSGVTLPSAGHVAQYQAITYET